MNPARKKEQEEPDEEAYDADLLEFKRAMEAQGHSVRLPKPGAEWIDREPIDFGASASDIVIRNRGREPLDPDLPEDLAALKRAAAEAGVPVRIPRPGVDRWFDFEPLPIDADEVSAMVVKLRREGL